MIRSGGCPHARGPGDNTLAISDDADSSHLARVVLKWDATADEIWDGFEADPLAWQGTDVQRVASDAASAPAHTGGHFLRVAFPASGTHYVTRAVNPPRDLRRHDCIRLALRPAPGSPQVPMYAISLIVVNGRQRTQFGLRAARPGRGWQYQTIALKDAPRDAVTSVQLRFAVTPGYAHPEQTARYDIDSITFSSSTPTAQADPPPPIPADYVSPYPERLAAHRPIPPIQEWFPLGIYETIGKPTRAETIYLLDRMKQYHMNTIYGGKCAVQEIAAMADLAEARGLRMVYQGHNLLFKGKTTADRARVFASTITPAVEQYVTALRGHGGILAWSLTEESDPAEAREIAPYYALMRAQDPTHPPTVLHNNLSAAQIDLEANKPLVITHDFYPFFWDPRYGPTTPAASLGMYRSHVRRYYEACRAHGARLWMMPQSYGQLQTTLDPPYYGFRGGMRMPEPGEMKQQGWLAIAEGAVGLCFFLGTSPKMPTLFGPGYAETPQLRAVGELFARVTTVAPLLCRLERAAREDARVRITRGAAVAQGFGKRAGYGGAGRYIVLASLDGFAAQEVGLAIEDAAHIYDMVARQEITGSLDALRLEAGEGTLLLIGTPEAFAADCAMIDEQLQQYYR